MKAAYLAACAVLALTVHSRDADAWLKFRNNTPNDVWVGNAYQLFKCTVLVPIVLITYGANDGCGDSHQESSHTKNDFLVRGWFKIAPGGTAMVDNQDWNMSRHQYYADDAFGHVWGAGNGFDFCTTAEPFAHCGTTCPANTAWVLRFTDISPSSTCCGPCPGWTEDHWVTLN